MKKLLLTIGAIILLTIFHGCSNQQEESLVNNLQFENPFNLPMTPHGGNILHAWNMSFVEITNQLPYIAEAGFGVIQTSPIGAALERRVGQPRRWYDLYQPTAFTIGNHLGTEEEFRELTKLAATYGIFIIVDAIPNHTTAYWDQIDEKLSGHEPSLFHNRPDTNDSHYTTYNVSMEFSNRRSFVRSNLLGLWDFYTGRVEFQNLYKEFLATIIDAGATGFRFDATHHIELPNDPEDIASDFWPVIAQFVNDRIKSHDRIPFQYGEILGGGYRANHYLHALYEDYQFLVTPYAFSRHIMGSVDTHHLVDGQDGWNTNHFHIHGNPQPIARGFGLPAADAPDLQGHVGFATGVVPWVESHDQYGNEGISRHLTNEQILAGWALIAARKDTTPLFLVRPGEGFVNSGNMFVLQDDKSHINAWGHQEFFKDPSVAAINWFANDFINYEEQTSTHGNLAIIERGPKDEKIGAVLVNLQEQTQELLIPTNLTDGLYICEISQLRFTVKNNLLSGPSLKTNQVVVLRNPQPLPHDTLAVVSAISGTTHYQNSIHFISESSEAEITLLTAHAEISQYILVRNGDLVKGPTYFHHNDKIIIGTNSTLGDVYILTLFGENSQGNIFESFVYVIGEAPEEQGIRIEYVRTGNQWHQANIWAWNPADVFSGGWPGPMMQWEERLDGQGYAWVFYFEPNTSVPINLMFNNSGLGEQTNYALITTSTRITGDNNINREPHEQILTTPTLEIPEGNYILRGRNRKLNWLTQRNIFDED